MRLPHEAVKHCKSGNIQTLREGAIILMVNTVCIGFQIRYNLVPMPCSTWRRCVTMSGTRGLSGSLYGFIILVIRLLSMVYVFSQANKYHYFCRAKVSYLWQKRKCMTLSAW